MHYFLFLSVQKKLENLFKLHRKVVVCATNFSYTSSLCIFFGILHVNAHHGFNKKNNDIGCENNVFGCVYWWLEVAMDDKQVSKSSWKIINEFKKVLHIYNENKLCISWRNHIWVLWKKKTWNVMFFTSSKNSCYNLSKIGTNYYCLWIFQMVCLHMWY